MTMVHHRGAPTIAVNATSPARHVEMLTAATLQDYIALTTLSPFADFPFPWPSALSAAASGAAGTAGGGAGAGGGAVAGGGAGTAGVSMPMAATGAEDAVDMYPCADVCCMPPQEVVDYQTLDDIPGLSEQSSRSFPRKQAPLFAITPPTVVAGSEKPCEGDPNCVSKEYRMLEIEFDKCEGAEDINDFMVLIGALDARRSQFVWECDKCVHHDPTSDDCSVAGVSRTCKAPCGKYTVVNLMPGLGYRIAVAPLNGPVPGIEFPRGRQSLVHFTEGTPFDTSFHPRKTGPISLGGGGGGGCAAKSAPAPAPAAPAPAPTTPAPSPSPAPPPVPAPSPVPAVDVPELHQEVPLWVWLLVPIAALLLAIAFCCFGITRRRRRRKPLPPPDQPVNYDDWEQSEDEPLPPAPVPNRSGGPCPLPPEYLAHPEQFKLKIIKVDASPGASQGESPGSTPTQAHSFLQIAAVSCRHLAPAVLWHLGLQPAAGAAWQALHLAAGVT